MKDENEARREFEAAARELVDANKRARRDNSSVMKCTRRPSV